MDDGTLFDREIADIFRASWDYRKALQLYQQKYGEEFLARNIQAIFESLLLIEKQERK